MELNVTQKLDQMEGVKLELQENVPQEYAQMLQQVPQQQMPVLLIKLDVLLQVQDVLLQLHAI